MTLNFPDTTKRVELNTDKYINEKDEEIISRMAKLNKEWDIERLLKTNSASIVIASTILGFTVNKKWFSITTCPSRLVPSSTYF
jgi:ferredoxin-thioredoxin reductase catalytic subunit